MTHPFAQPCLVLQTMLLTADHSPESVREFERMRFTHPASQLPQHHQNYHLQHFYHHDQQHGHKQQHRAWVPSLMVVYDSTSSNKLKCSPVFDVDLSGIPRVTGRGRWVQYCVRYTGDIYPCPLCYFFSFLNPLLDISQSWYLFRSFLLREFFFQTAQFCTLFSGVIFAYKVEEVLL